MVSLETAISFLCVSLILAYTPGPDNIFVLTQSAAQGRKAGFFVMLGLCAGLVIHTTAVALGLAALFAASALAFTILKWAGSAYLAYLAWLTFRSGTGGLPDAEKTNALSKKMFLRGILMNLTNPKVILFFLALLPQFVDPSRGQVVLQLYTLGLIFILSTLIAFGSIILFASALSARLRRSPKWQTRLNILAGVVFLGLAIRLALVHR